jgi:hypothetical protein
MFVLGAAGFLVSCLPSLFDFGTIRPQQFPFPVYFDSTKLTHENNEQLRNKINNVVVVVVVVVVLAALAFAEWQ